MTSPSFASAPFMAQLPGSVATAPRAPLYVEGIPVAQAALPASKALQAPSGQRFWSSEPRRYGDQTNEMMIVTLSSAKLLNYIALDLPHFPSQYSLAWRDAHGAWHWIEGPNGIVLQFIISGSVPGLVNNAAALTAGMNPYHYGAGHWIHYDEPIRPVTAGAILVAGTRALETVITIPHGLLPHDASGRPCPYPLGVRGLDFGYRVFAPADVPYTSRHPVIVTERQSFAVAEDINGSPVQLTMRENRASDLLGGHPWKSGPQPMSAAVVSLYADVRGPAGAAQVIDRFYVEPTTSGVSLNLYYASAPPTAGFQAVDTPLPAPFVTVNGSALPAVDTDGLLFGSAIGWLDLAAQGTGIDFTAPWWMGWEIQPQFGSTDPGSYMVADTGIVQLWYSAGTWAMTLYGGGTLATWPAGHAASDRLQFAAGWDGATLYCWSAQGGSVTMTPAATLPKVTLIRFGAAQQPNFSLTIWPGNYRLTSYILKQEAPAPDLVAGGVPAQFTQFASGPQAYAAPAQGPGPTTVNACARFDRSLVLGTPSAGLAPYGFAGGTGSAWTAATWIPVQLSFRLTAGFIQFPPVSACGFKFEFTNLAPEPYEYYTETPQKAKVFPVTPPDAQAGQPPRGSPLASSRSAVLSGPNTSPGSQPVPPSADNGMVVNASLAPQNFYIDAARQRTPPNPGAVLPTEALYGTDPHAAQALLQQGGSLYNFQQWLASPQGAPKQLIAGQETYQEVSVTASSRIAYFAGLSQLVMHRVDYTATTDTAEYIDTFGDTAGLNAAFLGSRATGAVIPWAWAPGLLTVPVNLPPGSVARIESPVFSSMHQVTGIQFAAVQAPPYQLLPDPGFLDPALPFVAAAGDCLPLTVSAGTSSPLGSLVMCSRAPGQISWAAMMASYPLWSAFTAPALSWLQMEGNPSTVPYGGLAYTGAPVTVSAAGRVHIAARVFASAALTAPLVLQLLDGSSGSVIAEQEVAALGSTVTEWFASFTLGDVLAPSAYTWAQVAGTYPQWNATVGQSWNAIDTFIPALGATLSWQLVQYGLTSDSWGVDDVSIFEDSIRWEFSNDGGSTWWPAYDVNANPNGALVFPPPAAGTGNTLRWRLSGYRPNLTVASLAVRPWYSCYPRGVPPRIPGIPHGPNVSHRDSYAQVENDPYWQTWSGPVPQAWYFAYSQLLLQGTSYSQPEPSPLPAASLVLGRGLAVPVAELTTGPVTYSDIYSDRYPSTYGVPDGSDIYTDNGGNGTYTSYTGPTP
jgi:hypothetical protein